MCKNWIEEKLVAAGQTLKTIAVHKRELIMAYGTVVMDGSQHIYMLLITFTILREKRQDLVRDCMLVWVGMKVSRMNEVTLN